MIANPHGTALSAVLLAAIAAAGFAPAQQPSAVTVGTACGGVGGPATFTAPSLPVIGSPLHLRVANLPPQVPGTLLVAWSGHTAGGQLAPVSLAPIGMTGCAAYPQFEQTYPFTTGNGTVNWDIWVPPVQSLVGATGWAQAFFQQPGLNAANVGGSNGVVLTFGNGSSGSLSSSVSQWGITWQFDQPYPVGQFCNGDWWVVGPVTVIGITPGTQNLNGRIINGSMINPPVNGDHGYDSTLYAGYGSGSFKSNLNVAQNLPITIQPSSSLISCISQIGTPSNGSVSQLRTAAVLTVLAAAPPADAFRPPYSGSDKTIQHRESQLDYSVLADLPPTAGAPSLASTASSFARVWLDHCSRWYSRYMHPVENMPDYYRAFTSLTGTAGLLLNSNYTDAQKRDLLVGLVQLGIDNYGNMVNGARWGVNGHCNGRKFPILFAGRVLNDAAMLSAGQTYRTIFNGPGHPANNIAPFSEDGQTFYVQETSPGVYNWGFGGYNASHAGMPEWGNFHTDNPSSARPTAPAARRTAGSARP